MALEVLLCSNEVSQNLEGHLIHFEVHFQRIRQELEVSDLAVLEETAVAVALAMPLVLEAMLTASEMSQEQIAVADWAKEKIVQQEASASD